MSKLEVLFREAVCPGTLPDDDPNLNPPPNSGTASIGDYLFLDGMHSMRRTSVSIRRSMSVKLGKSLPGDVLDDVLVELNQMPKAQSLKTRTNSIPPPPPPPPPAQTGEMEEALEAAARRRKSSVTASCSSLPPGAYIKDTAAAPPPGAVYGGGRPGGGGAPSITAAV
jgi:hypothetical protein